MIAAVTLVGAGAAACVLAGPGIEAQAQEESGAGGARNVILFVGDGMGDSEITLARNYELGAAGDFAMDTLPMTGDYTTYAVREEDPEMPDYVPDSASTGTAWATGSKTSNNRISTTAGTDEDLTTILELAQESGRLTGNVTTSSLTDATPAVLMSKVAARDCEGPEETAEDCPQDTKVEGGPGSIAEQSIDTGVNVLLGGGAEFYEQETDEGGTVLDSAAEQGYAVARTAEELAAAAPGQKVLGLFADDTLETVWKGEPARANFDVNTEPQTCEEGVQPAEQPTLDVTTQKAIEMLDNENGFFLQVEGASIDKQDHISSPCEQIGETIDFDNAVAVGLDYAAENPDTLVIVTADHGHTSQIIPGPASGYHDEGYEFMPPGESALLRTADGTDMLVTYATNRYRGEDGEVIEGEESEDSHTHTGTQVRLAAQGPLSERVLGKTDQTDLFYTMADAMGIDASGSSSTAASMPDTGGPDIPAANALAWVLGATLLSGGVLMARWTLRRNS